MRPYQLLGLFALFSTPAIGHIAMAEPKPFGNPDTSPLSPSGGNYPCKSDQAGGFSFDNPTNMAVGSQQTLSFKGTAVHGGGSCQLSLSKDKAPTKSSVFKVIKSIEGGCPGRDGATRSYQFEIPDVVPNGDYAFAWTWFNNIGNREMYMNCAPVTVTGSSAKGDDGFNKLPDMAIFNIQAEGGDCGTKETFDVKFPNEGQVLEADPGAKLTPPTGSCASGGGSSSGGSTSSGGSSGSSSGSSGSSGSGSSGSGSTGSESTGSGSSGSGSSGSGSSGSGSGSGSENAGKPKPKPSASSSNGGKPKPSTSSSGNGGKKPGTFAEGGADSGSGSGSASSSSSSGAGAAAAPKSTGTGSSSGSQGGGSSSAGSTSPSSGGAQQAPKAPAAGGSAGAGGGSCPTDGALVCNDDGTQFALCNHGKVRFMDVAAGTACKGGKIVKRMVFWG